MAICFQDLQSMLKKISGTESFSELDLHLAHALKAYKTSMYKGKITQCVVSLLLRKDVNTQFLALKYLKNMRHEVQSIPLDVQKMLVSSSSKKRRLGRRIVYIFWNLFEYEEAIVHLIHKRKMFRKHLAANSKYRNFYRISPSTPDVSYENTAPGPSTREEFLGFLDTNREMIPDLIYRHFYELVLAENKNESESSFEIPGIDDNTESQIEFELKLSGINGSEMFIKLQEMYSGCCL